MGVKHDTGLAVRHFLEGHIMADRGKTIRHTQLPPTTPLLPLPVALVACRDADGRNNIITIAWTGVVCSDPPMLSISVRPGRFSHELLEANGDFVVNLPSAGMMHSADVCGTLSGRAEDKFARLGWTALDASEVNAPLIKECPMAIECRTKKKLGLGTHDMYVAEVLAVQVHDELLDANGRLRLDALEPLAFCPNVRGLGEYWSLKEAVGHYGMSKEEHKR
jgi:flavin reductase (DIM6/NTAB) family NADH-FMN oxidoreductase RutF